MHPVRFDRNIETMYHHGVRFFIEAGPKTVLTGLTRRILAPGTVTAVGLDRSGGRTSGIADLAHVLCLLSAQGVAVDLTQWEDPVLPPVPRRLRIPLSGANPRPAPGADPRPVPGAGSVDMKPAVPAKPAEKPHLDPPNQPAPPRVLQQGPDMPSHLAASAQDAMHLIQKGLEAMQALQAQTARTHEKFLDTQAQAGQTLAAMMAQTRRFIDATPPGAPFTAPDFRTDSPAFLPADLPPRVNGETPGSLADTTLFSGDRAAALPPSSAGPASETGGPAEDPPPAIQPVLFDTVSRLTGFPVEMLEPGMDIESDLGIDSIKKVEIISELEKQLPGTRGLTTEHIGSARTLADICQAIASQASEPSGFRSCDTRSGDTRVCSPPAVPAQDPVSSPEPAGPSPAPEHALATLVSIISELTGFPEEMLEPGMDLESDLGIDSIKRVEILSRLEQSLGDRGSGLSGDTMSRFKTIGDMAAFLEKTGTSSERAVKKNPSPKDDAVTDPEEPVLVRQKILLAETPVHQVQFFNGSRIQIPGTGKIYLTRDQADMARGLKKAFIAQGLDARLIDLTDGQVPDLPDAAGLVIVQDQWQPASPKDPIAFLKTAFALAHANGPHLLTAAREKGAFLATVTFSGGGFGIPPFAFDTHPAYGGLAGLAKTAALEWKEVLCHALDLPCDLAACQAHIEAAAALMMTRGPVEMGLEGDHCRVPTLVAEPLEKGRLSLGPADVVVITGGARGVTAACAVELARTCTPVIVLLGRSPAPSEEPDWARPLTDPAALKKAILTHAFAGQKPSPADIEARFQAICANRQVQKTLDRIRSHGSQAVYRSVDIRRKKDLAGTLDRIRTRFGPIAGIIHGAGVLEDKWIVDKQPGQFDRVFDTKVDGLNNLLHATRKDPLRYVTVFSSIAARTGNPGQCDYAMANEVLNKTLVTLGAENSRCRFLAINWGPWDGGMVHDGLKQMFARKGVGLIPAQAGAAQMIQEMAGPDPAHTEIVITARPLDHKKTKPPVMTRVLEMTVSRETVPVITAHRINHAPVVPFALLAEIMAHAAEKNNPGLVFAGLDDMRLLKGVRPVDDPVTLGINLGKCTPNDTGYTAPASLTSGHENGQTRTHAVAVAILKNQLPDPPVLSSWHRMDLTPSRLTPPEAYDRVLFHGRDLQAITAITGISDKGIEVIAARAPAPAQWFHTPLQPTWVTDPLLLDAAFQAAILWTWETRGQVCLPSFLASFRIYSSFCRSGQAESGSGQPDDAVHILFTVNENTDRQIRGYFTFFNAQRTVVASIMGFEAVVDGSLHEKFKPAPLFDKKAILAFAQGNPSDAFGSRYQIFDDQRRIARLPRPPYFFMDRVLTADHPPWTMQPGGWIETEYDVPENAWYFTANHTRTLPFCILLEIALQPCGWLAAYAGSALHSDDRLHFRNLGGTARMTGSVFRDSGTLTVRTRMTDVSKAGGMILQDFDLQVSCRGRMVYQGTTSFGFFTSQALASQKGIRNSTLAMAMPAPGHQPVTVFPAHAPLAPGDPAAGPDTGMPARALCMVDRIDILDPSGGTFGNGYVCGSKKVDPGEWFFDAHFYQDPVCPGSLGVESFLQTLRFFLLETCGIDPATHEPQLMTDQSHEWIYRGQIIPANREITIHTHIRQVSKNAQTCTVVADGALCVDGLTIYEMKNFGFAFVHTLVAESENQRTRIFVPG
ncbi:MAG TPA: SDR family NAD(P)-dependent oxidoreductase [Desulfotignum sp.]|nr:SDR family NAD(P)-dependent oxidoreductase [Desulfotignum sp.]